jgi:hypothetical protein
MRKQTVSWLLDNKKTQKQPKDLKKKRAELPKNNQA